MNLNKLNKYWYNPFKKYVIASFFNNYEEKTIYYTTFQILKLDFEYISVYCFKLLKIIIRLILL